MNPVSKKHMQESEVLLFTPKPHWIIILGPFLLLCLTFPVYIALLPSSSVFAIVGLLAGALTSLLFGINYWLLFGMFGLVMGSLLNAITGQIIISQLVSCTPFKLPNIGSLLNAFFIPFIFVGGIQILQFVIENYLSEYYITNKRVVFKKIEVFKKGFITFIVRDIPIDKIESIYSDQTLIGMCFNCGTIQITGIGGKYYELFLIEKPRKVRRQIYEIMDKSKKITVIRNKGPEPATETQKKVVGVKYGTFVTSYTKE